MSIKSGCEEVLSEAMPALESAIKSLDTLKKDDIGELKGYKVPHEDILTLMQAVMLLKGIPEKK